MHTCGNIQGRCGLGRLNRMGLFCYTNSAPMQLYPNEMQHSMALYLANLCLSKHPFRSFQFIK